MESITENKKMFYTLTIPILTLVAIVLGWFPDFTQWFQLVEFEKVYRINVIKVCGCGQRNLGHGKKRIIN